MSRPRKHFIGEDFRLDTAMFRTAIQAAGTEPPSAPVDVWLD